MGAATRSSAPGPVLDQAGSSPIVPAERSAAEKGRAPPPFGSPAARSLRGLDSISSLPRLPLLGNLLDFRRDRIALLRRIPQECGDAGVFHLGPRRVLVLSSAEYAEAVLVDGADAFEKGPTIRAFARPILGDGLITSTNADHRRRRRLAAPSFSPRRIDEYARIMAADAESAQAPWRDGDTIDLAQEMARLALRIVGRVLFSVDLDREAPELAAALHVALRHVTGRIQNPLGLPLGFPTPHNLRVRRARARIDATLYRMISERRAGSSAGSDLLGSLIVATDPEDGSRLTDQQVRDEVMNIFVAGYETVADALAWCWFLLMSHPEACARLRGEVDGALCGRTPTIEDLPRLPFTARVLKEGLRLYPPVHTLGRQASRDVDVVDLRLPAGTVVVVSTFLIHRRADYFPRPDTFEPERFAACDDPANRYRYLPFGAGPRVCIGAHFATVEAQLILATLAQRVTFAPVAGSRIEPEMLVTLRPRFGIPAQVTRRPAVVGGKTSSSGSAT